MKRKKRKTTVTKKQKRIQQENHEKRSTQTLELKCSKMTNKFCKKNKGIWEINTNNEYLYTESVRKNWACPLCKKESK